MEVDRIKKINALIRDAKVLAKDADGEWNLVYLTAMNWLTYRAGLRQLTPLDFKTIKEVYGDI